MKNKIIINIGRQYGSGGHLIAEKLGEKLGINVYDHEIITKAAEESGISKNLFIENDETRKLFNLSSFFTSGRYVASDNYDRDNMLFNIQSDVINDIAEKENAVFVGRCSDYILREQDCLDVFISCPIKLRIANICKRHNVDEEEAESIINKKDGNRETYYNYYTLGNWGQADNYDLCIDSSKLGIEGSADLIIDYLKINKKI